jgi:hypothetical protein
MTGPTTLIGNFGFALILFNLLGWFLGWAWWINTLAALSMFIPVVGALTMNVYQFAAVIHLVHLIFKW